MSFSLEPLSKVLFINVHPGSFPFAAMVPLTFGEDVLLHNWDVSVISSLPKEYEPKLVRREDRSKLPLPSCVHDYKAIVITGSSYAARPRKREDGSFYLVKWKREGIEFIREAHYSGIPILGVCFGEQFVAEALGGRVIKMPSRLEKGWNRITLPPDGQDDVLLHHLPSQFVAAQNHGDTVEVLPEGATLLAENEFGVQGFRLGNSVGIEFHPERTPEQVVAQLDEIEDHLKYESQMGMTIEANHLIGKEYRPDITRIFSNFLRSAWTGQ